MPLPTHPTRSWLFVPGDDPKKLQKSLTSAADVLIYDLEDSVAPACKETARDLTSAALRQKAASARYVRINALDTGLAAADVARTIEAKPDGYVLPKCEGPDDIESLAALIRSCGSGHLPPILAIATETVRAVRNLMRQDWEHPMLIGLTWGGEDLQADLGAWANRDPTGSYLAPFVFARDLALLAAKDAGVLAIDAVFTDFRDETGLAKETGLGVALGFDGKMAIHPAQIEVIHRSMAPTTAQLDWARRVVDLIETSGEGVAQLDGKMLDRPHLRLAHKILARRDGL